MHFARKKGVVIDLIKNEFPAEMRRIHYYVKLKDKRRLFLFQGDIEDYTFSTKEVVTIEHD